MSTINLAIEIDEVVADGLVTYLEEGGDGGEPGDEATAAALVVLLSVANALPESR